MAQIKTRKSILLVVVIESDSTNLVNNPPNNMENSRPKTIK